jgi:multidrug transporter EmrE-like cation transporter
VNYLPGLIYVGLTVALTVYGQLVIKWQVNLAGSLPNGALAKVEFLAHLLMNVWVLSAFTAAFLASLTWIAAMTKFQLSYAYPFMSLNFVVVLFLSIWLFDESLTTPKVVGLLLIIAGIVVSSRG